MPRSKINRAPKSRLSPARSAPPAARSAPLPPAGTLESLRRLPPGVRGYAPHEFGGPDTDEDLDARNDFENFMRPQPRPEGEGW